MTTTTEPSPILVKFNATTVAVREAVDRALARVRVALDLPSRTELAALSARLDAIDARLLALGDGRKS